MAVAGAHTPAARPWRGARAARRTRGATAAAAAVQTTTTTLGYSPEQLAFLERKTAEAAAGGYAAPAPAAAAGPPPPAHWFHHGPLAMFALDQLTPKGLRKNPDVGSPEDFTRPLIKGLANGTASCGSWACTEGGWDSPNRRATTEWFYVLSGEACVTDPDGTPHRFAAGDIVVLPKGWHGRWDVTRKIHKVWCVHDHPDIPGGDVTPVVVSGSGFAPHLLKPSVGKTPARLSREVYDNGYWSVGYWSCEPGSFAVPPRQTTECFHVLAGVFFLTNADGSARRCVAGDTVVLPKGWSGHWDIIERVEKMWVDIDG